MIRIEYFYKSQTWPEPIRGYLKSAIKARMRGDYDTAEAFFRQCVPVIPPIPRLSTSYHAHLLDSNKSYRQSDRRRTRPPFLRLTPLATLKALRAIYHPGGNARIAEPPSSSVRCSVRGVLALWSRASEAFSRASGVCMGKQKFSRWEGVCPG